MVDIEVRNRHSGKFGMKNLCKLLRCWCSGIDMRDSTPTHMPGRLLLLPPTRRLSSFSYATLLFYLLLSLSALPYSRFSIYIYSTTPSLAPLPLPIYDFPPHVDIYYCMYTMLYVDLFAPRPLIASSPSLPTLSSSVVSHCYFISRGIPGVLPTE